MTHLCAAGMEGGEGVVRDKTKRNETTPNQTKHTTYVTIGSIMAAVLNAVVSVRHEVSFGIISCTCVCGGVCGGGCVCVRACV